MSEIGAVDIIFLAKSLECEVIRIMFLNFFLYILADGMTYSFGLFFDEFLTYFNEGKGYTAWIVSIMVGVTFASGKTKNLNFFFY